MSWGKGGSREPVVTRAEGTAHRSGDSLGAGAEGGRERERGERWCVGKDRNKVPKCGQGGVLRTDKALPTVITWLKPSKE